MEITKINLHHVLFLDIETVPLYSTYTQVSAFEQELWEEKTRYLRGEVQADEFYHRAGIWAEFGKIICISVGYFARYKDERIFRVRSFTGEEINILQDFLALVNKFFNKPQHFLAAHNGKEFDFPFIARRLLIHGLPIPTILNVYGKKPWQFQFIDTLEMWKFGDYKHYTSLKLLSHVLGIPTPKAEINGENVREVFYIDNDIGRIAAYCQGDTIAVAQIVLRLRGEQILQNSEIYLIN